MLVGGKQPPLSGGRPSDWLRTTVVGGAASVGKNVRQVPTLRMSATKPASAKGWWGGELSARWKWFAWMTGLLTDAHFQPNEIRFPGPFGNG